MAHDIPHWRVTLGAASANLARWRTYGTDSTPTNVAGQTQDYMGTPAAVLSGVQAKAWEWWWCVSVLVPVGYSDTGSITFCNPHNAPGDVGGIGWNWGDLVSSVQFNYEPANNRIIFKQQPNFPNHVMVVVPSVVKGQRYDFVCQVIKGRLDQQLGLNGPGVSGGGIGNHPNNGAGRARVWVNGSDTPFDSGNVNNLQRRVSPNDGLTYTETVWYRQWDGWYSISPPSPELIGEAYVTRVGRSVGEALEDGSNGFTLFSEWAASGGGAPAGTSSTTDLTPLSSDDFLVPASLGGVPAPPDPPAGAAQTGPWGSPIQWNSVTADPPTAIEQMVGPWGDSIQWDSTAGPQAGTGAAGRFLKRFHGPALLSTAANDLYTVPSGRRAVIRNIHVSNPSSESVDFTLSIGTDAAATRLWDGYPIAPRGLLQHYNDHTLVAGEKIQAYATFSNILNLTITGYEENLVGGTVDSGSYGQSTYGSGTYGSN